MVIYNQQQQQQQESLTHTPTLTVTHVELIVRPDSSMKNQRLDSLAPQE